MAAEPTFAAIDTDSLQQAIPKGKPGRKLSDHPRAVQARAQRAAKRAQGPQKAPRKPSTRARGSKSLRPEIGALLTMANALVVMSPVGTRPVEAITDPNVETERLGYELDAAEIDALAGAIDAQCRRSPRFRKVVEGMLTASAGGALVTVVGMIAARRMARAGILPPMLDPMLGLALSGDNLGALMNVEVSTPTPEPDPVTGERQPIPLDFDNIDGGMPLGMEP
jgi:hypothetical protein